MAAPFIHECARTFRESILKKQFLHISLVLASALLTVSAAHAADPFHAVATASISHSGDDLQVARFANGDPVNVHGGSGYAFGAGGAWTPDAYPVMVSLLASYQYDPRAGGNTSATFRRVPLDAMVYYTGMQSLRFGVGLNYTLASSVKASIDGRDQTIKLDNAAGKSFEIGYEIKPNVWANLRLTSEKFKPKAGSGGQDASLSRLGINISYLY